MALLNCNSLSFAYEGKIIAKDITFSVESGDYLCIVGENGAGKTTLMKGLLRLKSPSSGSIEFGQGLKPKEIGYLPQQKNHQKDFPADVFEVVLSGCLNRLGFRPFFTRIEKNIAREKMEQLGISHLKNTCYRQLSGGQQHRVLLARALCSTQKLLVLDEPVAGLDPYVTQTLYTLIEKINRDLGLTIIMVSHDIQGILQYANKILHLGNGQSFFGTTSEYLSTSLGQQFAKGEKR